MRVVINGKFLRAPSTGVHRVAAELTAALMVLKRENDPAVADLDFELLMPFDGVARAASMTVPKRVLGRLTGIPWEQITLPLRRGPGLLLNLCNIGPPLDRNAVTMIHDAQVHLSPQSYGRGFRAWYRFIQPAFARRHRLILTVSEYSRQEIARVGLAPLDRIAVVQNGVDHLAGVVPDPEALASLGLLEQGYAVAFATTQAHKNIAVLLRAFDRPELAGVRLVLVGSEKPEAFAAAGLAIPSNVIFAGRASDGALRALIEGATCLAFPSLTEGFGLPPLEAMMLGCPAIVAPKGALPEVCGNGAMYVDPHDDAAWASAIASLSHDRSVRDTLIAAGKARASVFTWRRSALRLAEVLNGLAEPARK